MTEPFTPIRARAVPLSHADPEPAPNRPGARRPWLGYAGLVGAAALLVGVFVVLPRLLEPPSAAEPQTTAPTPSPAQASATGDPANARDESRLAPFEQLQRDQARAEAQIALSRFVELQLQLETRMQVGAWGSDAYDEAKDLAAAGDEAFLRERFTDAIGAYNSATAALEALIATGAARLEDAITAGMAALAERDAVTATAAFAEAATVAPEDPRVVAGATRAALLPELNELLRRGRNLELAGDWSAALATLREAQQLDPETTGLSDALARVGAAAGRAQLQTLISAGFAHLEAGRHEEARRAFNDALRLAPGNPAAQGGLEQVDRRAEINRLARLQQDAERALADERWVDAERLYGEALALDANLQFAIDGRSQARARQQAFDALAAIAAEPDRLSSERVFQDAQATLARAEGLDPRGPRLSGRIEEIRALLAAYAQPVAVVLRSDNRTQITVSSVGPLGAFSEKQLTLRPGAYTVVGSRDGCRDVREQIVVRAEMAPIDIRCVETL